MTVRAQESRPEPIVATLDHVGVLAEDADALFALLAETFDLPVAWPMTDFGTFASGGVRAGTINLEVVRAAGGLRRFLPPDRPARYWILAFQPAGALDDSLARLEARGIPHRREAPGPLFTNVTLTELAPRSWTILCHYLPGYSEQYAALEPELRERGGGPLGLTGATEVTVGVTDMAGAAARWEQLLAPADPAGPGYWRVGGGAAVRVEPTGRDEIAALTLSVRDLDRATRFLSERQLLGEGAEGRVTVAPERLGSLRLELVAAPR